MQTFKVRDYKGICGTVEVSVDGGSIVVQGQNAAGKSSFIDAITELFDARGIRLTPHPINDSAEDAEAEFIDTNLDVRIRREWKRDKHGGIVTTITVHALDGAKHTSPSRLIADLLGGRIFDPSRFLLLDPKPQRAELLKNVELPFDLEALEGQERAAEDERQRAGQVARAAEGAVTNADMPVPGTPTEPLSTTQLVMELDAARQQNTQHDVAVSEKEKISRSIGAISARLVDIEENRKRLDDEELKARAEQKQLAESLNAVETTILTTPRIDTTEIEERVKNIDEINRNVQLGITLRKLEAEAAEKRSDWEECNKEVEKIRAKKDAGLAQAKFPHPSISVSEEGVLIDGVPFSQVNSGRREEVAFAIATSGDPNLKLVIVKNGDMLDPTSLENIDRFARERDYTVLVERGRPDTGNLVATFVQMEAGVQK